MIGKLAGVLVGSIGRRNGGGMGGAGMPPRAANGAAMPARAPSARRHAQADRTAREASDLPLPRKPRAARAAEGRALATCRARRLRAPRGRPGARGWRTHRAAVDRALSLRSSQAASNRKCLISNNNNNCTSLKTNP